MTPTEIRAHSDMACQIELERLLAKRRAEEAARAARFANKPTPDETNDARWEWLSILLIVTVGPPLAMWLGHIALMIARMTK